MRTLASDLLQSKTKILSASAKLALSRIVALFEGNDEQYLLSHHHGFTIRRLPENVMVLQKDGLHLYFTVGKDKSGPYALLLDLTEETPSTASSSFFAINDPRKRPSLNPKFNTQINPTFNTKLNPKFNTRINPTFNTRLNPTFNTRLNPKFNTRLNPKFNTQINPSFNTRLNPKFNTQINPTFNRAYGGPFLYDAGLSNLGFVVGASSDIGLLFDNSAEWTGFTVVVSTDFTLEYSLESEWRGFWITTSEPTSLRFDEKGEWDGIVV